MACIVTDLPRYVALNTATFAQTYISKSLEILNWTPEPIRLGYDLIAAIETKRFAKTDIDQLAHDTAITVLCYGTHISGEIRAAVTSLANEVYQQVCEMDLYINGELAYGFKSWAGLQLIMEKIHVEHLHEFLNDPTFQDDYELPFDDLNESIDSPWEVRCANGRYTETICKSNEHKRLQALPYRSQRDYSTDFRMA